MSSLNSSINFKTAKVAVLGRPNAGKSTLLNALSEVDFSAVSTRPQTTRSNIRGILQIYNEDKEWSGQIVLIDTPGINFKKGLLDRAMTMSVEAALKDVDVVLWVADARTFHKDLRDMENKRPGSDKLAAYLYQHLKEKTDTKWLLVLSKSDLVNKTDLLPIMARASELQLFDDIIPIAAQLGLEKKNSNLDRMMMLLKNLAPTRKPLYDEEAWTDLNERQLIQNLIREAIFRQGREEVPYQCDATIFQFIEADGLEKKMNEVDATIWVAKDSLKPIMVGNQGSRIKEIGHFVRTRYKEITGEDIVLRLFVKVVDKWESRATHLAELGYVLS